MKSVAGKVTPNSTGDSEVLGEMLDDIDGEIAQVSADGAYDRGYCYDYIEERGASAAIPPRKDAIHLDSWQSQRADNIRVTRT